MTIINQVAEYVSGAKYPMLPAETVEHAKMSLLDTIGASLVGAKTRDGVAHGKLLASLTVKGEIPIVGYKTKTDLLPSIIIGCAVTRSTEFDDINLKAQVTPGSMVVPTAFSLANAGYISDPKEFLLAIALGYETFVRLGMAINGPVTLYQGIWPTHLGAGLGAGTVAARAMKLNAQQTASALATTLTMSTAIEGKIRRDAPFTRYLTAGVAAQNGVVAAFSARDGFVGDETFLDNIEDWIYGDKLYSDKMTDGLGKWFAIDETGTKPYPIGRQGLTSIEAFRELLTTNKIDPESIQEITVRVPKWHVKWLSRPTAPGAKLSPLGLHYQMGLVAYAPDQMLNPFRERPPLDARTDSLITKLADKITIKPSPELMQYYPAAWPARVDVKTDKRRYSVKMLHPKGDADNRFTWDELAAKFMRVAKVTIGEEAGKKVVSLVKEIDAAPGLAPIIKLLG